MTADTATRIVAQAEESLRVLDEQIDQMRNQRTDLNEAIAQALANRKPLARIVSAAKGRKSQSNGDTQ